VLYVGVMVTKDGPKLVEYNARFGDPEVPVLMPADDVGRCAGADCVCRPATQEFQLRWYDDAALTVIMATRGFPGDYGKAR
jgi:phosphoribosylamine--glycine ligase